MTFVKTVETKVVTAVEFSHRDVLDHEAYKAHEAEKFATAQKRCEKAGWDKIQPSISFDCDPKEQADLFAAEQDFLARMVALAAANNLKGFAK